MELSIVQEALFYGTDKEIVEVPVVHITQNPELLDKMRKLAKEQTGVCQILRHAFRDFSFPKFSLPTTVLLVRAFHIELRDAVMIRTWHEFGGPKTDQEIDQFLMPVIRSRTNCQGQHETDF